MTWFFGGQYAWNRSIFCPQYHLAPFIRKNRELVFCCIWTQSFTIKRYIIPLIKMGKWLKSWKKIGNWAVFLVKAYLQLLVKLNWFMSYILCNSPPMYVYVIWPTSIQAGQPLNTFLQVSPWGREGRRYIRIIPSTLDN